MASTHGKLVLDDIADVRAYEREREEFRRRVIALKKRRRVHLGPVMTLVFESRDTIRFQIQEMARAEKLISDEAIQGELDIYNPLIPESGQLCATVFLELVTDEELRRWLPRLVGIEGSLGLRLGDGPAARVVRARPESAHAERLTRDEITASVHYVWWELSAEEVGAASAGPVYLFADHPEYQHELPLEPGTVEELLGDLRNGG